jgi:predicted phosphoadenosine phosphosulfate sulfurtransferase
LDLSDSKSLLAYMQALLANMESFRRMPDSEIILSASDIPAFSFIMFKDLAFFKFFSWSKNVYNFPGSYEEFLEGLDTDDFLKCYKAIVNNYQLIPSTEIWSASTIDSFLSLLNYHCETGSFNDKKFPRFICEQLLDLMDQLQNWTEKGLKSPNDTPFKFYVSECAIENTFALFKQPENTKCIIKLFTINSLFVSDEEFCKEMEKWLSDTAQRATLISGGSAKERYKFFQSQKQKIRLLIDSLPHECFLWANRPVSCAEKTTQSATFYTHDIVDSALNFG